MAKKPTSSKPTKQPSTPKPAARRAGVLESAERVYVGDRAAWRRWLQRNHTRTVGIWLVFDKKSADGHRPLSYEDIVEESLCFGWIDSLPRKLSTTQSMIYVSPRKPRSVWSALNKRRLPPLIENGLMTAAGLAKIDAAKADGSWSVLDAAESLEIPPDLSESLSKLPPASTHFAAFPPSTRRGILWWIHSAKRPETRAQRVAETTRLAALNQRAR